MTKTNEMPGVIYIQNDPEFQGIVGGVYSLVGDRDEIQYHHTAALIERLEGMKKDVTKELYGASDEIWREHEKYCEAYNAALQDVIDILKGERE